MSDLRRRNRWSAARAMPCAVFVAAFLCGCGSGSGNSPRNAVDPANLLEPVAISNWNMKDKVIKSEEEWKKLLDEEQFRILRKKGTERPFTGALWDNHEKGVYRCSGCGLELFDSETKFESGTGWPSFYKPIAEGHVDSREDKSLFTTRTEILCARCDGHLGHVFDDGPDPTGLRYCINSASLRFEKEK